MRQSLGAWILLVFLAGSGPAVSGEITDKEYDILGDLVVTYFSGGSGKVECTVFNPAGKPIGGGYSFAAGGVARVSISVPKKYVGKDLKVVCR